ncbi:MAG: ATP-binding cassette domain-containing protein [Clostridia bacterium]
MIEIKKLEKTIDNKKILDDINLTFEDGNIYAFVGKNGSGKSMLFKYIANWIDIDQKSIVYTKNYTIRTLIERPAFMEDLSAIDNLLLLNKNYYKKMPQIYELFKTFMLYENKDMLVGKYSLGMKQKLGIIQALIDDPALLILDEPFNGLDESSVNILRVELLKLKNKGKIILMSSHIKEDIECLANKIIYIKEGKIINVENSTPLLNSSDIKNEVSKTTLKKVILFSKVLFILTLLTFIMFSTFFIIYIIDNKKNSEKAIVAFNNQDYIKAFELIEHVPYTKFSPEKEKINYYFNFLSLKNFATKSKNKEEKLLCIYLGLQNIKKEQLVEKTDWKLDSLFKIEKIYYEYASSEFSITQNKLDYLYATEDKNEQAKRFESLKKELSL